MLSLSDEIDELNIYEWIKGDNQSQLCIITLQKNSLIKFGMNCEN